MRALFCVPTPHDQSLDLNALQWMENGERRGGWWVVGATPQGNTMMVVVDTTPAMIEAMSVNPEYLFIEEIPDDAKI